MILFATVVSVLLLPPLLWSLTGIVRFVPFFLWRSLSGGVDVARRALHPQLPISPGLFHHRWRLPPGLPRVFMANTVSLLPGTLSLELDANCLQVHVLDEGKDFLSELKKVEQRVAAMFGIFGALLVLVLLLGKSAIHYFGETGLYLLAFVSGIADVDPINLTLSRMSITELPLEVAVLGIVIAASTNTLVKAVLAVFVGGFGLGVRVIVPLLIAVGAGLLTARTM